MTKPIQLNSTPLEQALYHDINVAELNQAYIKQETFNNELVWSIYNDQGEKMGYAADRNVAFAIVSQNDFVGLSVH